MFACVHVHILTDAYGSLNEAQSKVTTSYPRSPPPAPSPCLSRPCIPLGTFLPCLAALPPASPVSWASLCSFADFLLQPAPPSIVMFCKIDVQCFPISRSSAAGCCTRQFMVFISIHKVTYKKGARSVGQWDSESAGIGGDEPPLSSQPRHRRVERGDEKSSGMTAPESKN